MADEPTGLYGAARDLGRDLISALPPAFTLLLVINVIFLALVMWFIDDQIQQRTELVAKVIEHCFAKP
jgi:hypothetical protein